MQPESPQQSQKSQRAERWPPFQCKPHRKKTSSDLHTCCGLPRLQKSCSKFWNSNPSQAFSVFASILSQHLFALPRSEEAQNEDAGRVSPNIEDDLQNAKKLTTVPTPFSSFSSSSRALLSTSSEAHSKVSNDQYQLTFAILSTHIGRNAIH